MIIRQSYEQALKLVPIKHSEDIRAAFEKKNVTNRLVVFENAGHGFQKADLQKAMSEMASWFEQHLVEKQETKP